MRRLRRTKYSCLAISTVGTRKEKHEEKPERSLEEYGRTCDYRIVADSTVRCTQSQFCVILYITLN